MQLHKAKRQLCGQLAIASENELSSLLSVGRSYLQTGRADTFEQACARVEAVTALQLQKLAREVFSPERLTTLLFKRKKR